MATKKAASGSLKLSPVLALTEASALHGTLMSMRGRHVTIAASEVERVGVQCVQVLIAGARAWKADKKSYVVDKSSDAFAKTMQLIGIDTDLLVAKEISK